MEKKAFVTKEMIEKIAEKYPTPFHIYDEKGIRENAKALKEAFAWNKGYKEFFAVKATPNPFHHRYETVGIFFCDLFNHFFGNKCLFFHKYLLCIYLIYSNALLISSGVRVLR
jgi:hypothetical protein